MVNSHADAMMVWMARGTRSDPDLEFRPGTNWRCNTLLSCTEEKNLFLDLRCTKACSQKFPYVIFVMAL